MEKERSVKVSSTKILNYADNRSIFNSLGGSCYEHLFKWQYSDKELYLLHRHSIFPQGQVIKLPTTTVTAGNVPHVADDTVLGAAKGVRHKVVAGH